MAKGLNLAEVRLSVKKREVRRAITQYYIGKNVFAAEVLENIPEKAPASGTAQLELEKLRLEHAIKLKQLEAAEKVKERAEQEREYEEKEKQRQHDLDMEKLRQERRAQGPDREERFNVSREFRLVPPFEEKDLDSYFLHFEKVAVSQKWLRDQWVALLQSVLKGKAQRAYVALSERAADDYKKIKQAFGPSGLRVGT